MDDLIQWWHAIVPFVWTLLEIAGFASVWHAVRRVRSSQAAVAWAVGLVAMPLIALPIYWVFGRDRFSGYREAIREVEKHHRKSVGAVRHELFTEKNAGTARTDAPLDHIADVMDTPVCGGNEFELLIDGEAFFDAVIAQIDSARLYVYAEFYQVFDDETGRRFADALCRCAARGVLARLLYDEIGSHVITNSLLKRMRDAGVDVQTFNTRQGFWNRLQLNFRNHRKLIVIDGRSCIVGGLNIGDDYLGKKPSMSPWRDTAILATGPISRKVQAVFAGDYYWARRSDLPEADWGNDTGPPAPLTSGTSGNEQPKTLKRDRKGAAAIFSTGPTDFRSRGSIMFMAAAATARERLWISTPYLVPDDTTMTALSMARARGVDVRVLIPAKADMWLMYLASFYYEDQLQGLEIPVFRYDDGFLHQKCVLIDDRLAMIGSTNLDNRSLYLNFEMMLATDSPRIVCEVTAMLKRDFAKATDEGKQGGRLRPWYQRVGTVLTRLLSPIL